MDPGPSSFAITAEDRVALFCHGKPVRADAVETVVPEHEARSQNNSADVCERQRLSFEPTAEGEQVVRVRFGALVHDGSRDLAENRASGRVNKPSSGRPRRQFLQGGEQRTIGLEGAL